MCPPNDVAAPERLISLCGADCSQCDTYRAFLGGDEGGLVNNKTGYRCCWLPQDYPEGRDCPIRVCCEGRAILFCGECARFNECDRMEAFYAQPGYDALRRRMLAALERVKEGTQDPSHE